VGSETAADGEADTAGTTHAGLPAVGAAAGEEEAGLDRIWTVPNLLSIGRLALLGVFLWLLFGEHERVAATVVLMVTGTTDFLDGYVARRLHQVTTLGKVLDPTADRIVVGTGVIAIAAYGAVPWWLAGIVLGREVAVSGAVLALAAIGARRIDVLWVGKAGTFGLMCCFPLFLLGDAGTGWARDLHNVTWVLVVPALAFSFVAAVAYVPVARRALAERNAPPAGAVLP
jgi:cardiolipin synthase (CMP-forming)